MKKSHLILAFLVCSLFAFTVETTNKPKWVSIFNGKDFSGWTMKVVGQPLGENYGNTFRVADGILSIRYDNDVYKKFNNQFGAFYYKKKLTNYRLKLEYRFVGDTATGAPSWGFRDSGVQFHGQSPESVGLTQQFPVCLEVNFQGGDGTKDRPTGEICLPGTIVNIDGKPNTSFCTPPTVKRTFHGDQWVTVEVDVQGSKIAHFINGEEVMRYEDPRYNPKNENAKALIVNGNDKITSGYISFQSNSHPIDFRKIELMEY
ncbi:MAG TPA: DUF1080 domain-containing protein [Cyclobacteriaceae bacterium]|nr:DUF1080 domain-containing protein [Cyclobacteriaceae bacterium]